MAKVDCEIRGVDTLAEYLDSFDPKARRAARRALKVAGTILLGRVQANAQPHERSGELQGALRVRTRGDSVDVGAFGGDANHFHLVEFGHGGPKPAPPYPILKPAIDDTEDEIEDAIAREIFGELDL